jgi:soluble lytic murein transglycosylase
VRLRRFIFLLGVFPFLVGVAAAAERSPALGVPGEGERRFAAALEAFRAGEWGVAVEGFRAAGAPPELLEDYAQFFLAESLSRVADLPGARRVAERMVARHPRSPLIPQALLLLAVLVARQEDEPSVETILRRFLSEFGHHPDATLARYLLGRALEVQNRGQEAARLFRDLWLGAPASAYADAAADHLERLGRAGITLPPPAPAERLERAERLLANGLAAVAREEAEAILARGTDPEIAVRALRLVADAWRRLGRYGAAAHALDRALGRAPAERHPDLLLELARVHERSGSRESALETAARLLREHSGAREVPQALLLRGRVFEETGRSTEAAAAYDRVVREFPYDPAAGSALWQIGWPAFIQGNLSAAAQRLGQLTELPGAGPYRQPAGYWAGRSREQLGESEEARRFYLAVLNEAPRSYYGLLAARRLTGVRIKPGLITAPPLPADPFTPLAGDRRLARVEALRALGLAHFAMAELEELLVSSPADLPKLYGVSAVYAKTEQYHLALRILRRHFADLAGSGSPALPRAFWELYYPMGWAREIQDASRRVGLDPHLVAAFVREESSFFPRALSRAGARGLMQLMPETARPMAARRGLPFDQGALLDAPEANLQMGTLFLAGLLKEFGDPRLAAAAYNAGPARVRKWWAARRSDDLEVFVEQIPFDETRHFVKRVVVAWEEYRRIYGGDPGGER